MGRQIVLDTETTGLEPEKGHRVIEIGCLEMVNRRITGRTLHRYINPEREVEREAEQVHGISNEFLKDKPVFKEVVAEIIDFIRDSELIIHNAPFDVNFLNHEFQWAGPQYLKVSGYCQVFDTLTFARRKHPGQHNSLDALCRRYSIDNSNRELHGALLDAELLAQVYLLMTGGQAQLFQAEQGQQTTAVTATSIRRLDSAREPLSVIQASEQELQAHQKFIDMITD